MKKTRKIPLTLLLIMILAAGLTGCAVPNVIGRIVSLRPAPAPAESGETAPGPAGITGIWDCSEVFAENLGMTAEEMRENCGAYSFTIEFKADGTFRTSLSAGGQPEETESGTYTVSGNTVTTNGETAGWKVEDDVLTLSWDGQDFIMPRVKTGPAGS